MNSRVEQAREEARTENQEGYGDDLYRDSRRRQFGVHDLR